MAKRKARSATLVAVSAERATRLYRLLKLLGKGPQRRTVLTRKLRLGVRGFYRDLEVVRTVGIHIKLGNSRYHLVEDLTEAIDRLPFPDPGLSLGEARLIARGRSPAHKKIREQLGKIER